MLILDETTFGIHPCELNLSSMFPTANQLHSFRVRFEEFMASDPANEKIFSLSSERLIYRTETFITDQKDDRPPLLLLLGNPASHSIDAGMCFAFEGDRKEHRFWKGLDQSGILRFNYSTSPGDNPASLNMKRRAALLNLDYVSPFRVGIAVFYSIPSPASAPKWSGVSGLKRLLGAEAFRMITQEEERRIEMLVSKFLSRGGAIIAFQKDAYNGVRSPETPQYSSAQAKQGSLRGKYQGGENILLVGSPPTRLMHSHSAQIALLKYKHWLFEQLLIQSA